jgi:hypothetical protein
LGLRMLGSQDDPPVLQALLAAPSHEPPDLTRAASARWTRRRLMPVSLASFASPNPHTGAHRRLASVPIFVVRRSRYPSEAQPARVAASQASLRNRSGGRKLEELIEHQASSPRIGYNPRHRWV